VHKQFTGDEFSQKFTLSTSICQRQSEGARCIPPGGLNHLPVALPKEQQPSAGRGAARGFATRTT
jgi:hypothetical protein